MFFVGFRKIWLRGLWRSLEVFRGFWRFLEVFGGFWRFLEVFGGFWRSLEVFGDFWRFLEVFEIFWRSLEVFGGSRAQAQDPSPDGMGLRSQCMHALIHFDSHGLTWIDLFSLGLTWSTWIDLGSLEFIWIRSHLDSL